MFDAVDPLINDREMPTLAPDLMASGLVFRAAWFSLAGALAVLLWQRQAVVRLLSVQMALLLFHLTALVPIAELLISSDNCRCATLQTRCWPTNAHEPLAMVGAMKPSVHFHTGQVIVLRDVPMGRW